MNQSNNRNRRWKFIGLCFITTACLGQAQDQAAGPLTKEALADFALHQAGAAARGKTAFADEARTACAKCHSTDGRGSKAGPDLAAIGDKFPRRELIRSILEPSATIAVGYGTTLIETKDGEEVQGVIKQATESWLELMGGDGKPARVAMSDIREQRTSEVSLMPQGLEAALTPQ